MLVLSRKVGESFVIGDDVRITVVRVGNNGVRIGIEAPEGYEVIRKELQGLISQDPPPAEGQQK